MVYVDQLIRTNKSRKWHFNSSCHMLADTEKELHEMAEKIGLQQRWFQDNARLKHYDLTAAKRQLAIVLGAKEIDRKDIYKMFNKEHIII